MQIIQVFASWVNADFWLNKITQVSRNTRELQRHLLQRKFALGR